MHCIFIKILSFCRKLKLYEEQELTMQVFNEPEQVALDRHDSEYTQVSDCVLSRI